MEIRNIRHKGLRNLVEKDNPKGLAPQYIPKIRAIMAFLIDMEDIEEIYNPVSYTHLTLPTTPYV